MMPPSCSIWIVESKLFFARNGLGQRVHDISVLYFAALLTDVIENLILQLLVAHLFHPVVRGVFGDHLDRRISARVSRTTCTRRKHDRVPHLCAALNFMPTREHSPISW